MEVNIGDIYGRLTVVKLADTGWAKWVCRCSCGAVVTLRANKLLSGNNKSCGCLKRMVLADATRTHGRANSSVSGYKDRTYGIWQAMRDRCSNPNRKDWHRYGGAGISVDASWESFSQFVSDMGNAPAGRTLDRIDGTRGYGPDNCRWATPREQSLNSSRSRVFEIEGVRDSISGWARRWGVGRAKALKLLLVKVQT
jgi:hypothetical protein